ncbi:hypothetical protein ACOSQ2_005329 [Xanthoceras sorbifolium]
METRGKTNAEFRSEVHEIFSRHETSFDVMQNNYQQLNHSIQAVVAELQAMRMSQATHTHITSAANKQTKPTIPLHYFKTEITPSSSSFSLSLVEMIRRDGLLVFINKKTEKKIREEFVRI